MAASIPHPPPAVRKPRTQSAASRRTGYVATVVVNLILLILLNVAPGWQDIGFLTPDFEQVLFLVDLSLVVSIVANIVYLARDGLTKNVGDLVTTGIALAVLLRLWALYPFVLSGVWVDVVPIVFGLATLFTVIALLVLLGQLVHRLLR